MSTLLDVDLARWQRRFEFHLDLIPKLLGAQLTLGTVTPGVSRGGSRFDRPQVTGGGYYDQIPEIDQRTAADATYLWSLFADYVTAAAEWLGATASIPAHCPDTPRAAHDTALIVIGTLVDHAHLIHEHRELDDFETEMFAEIRRMQRRYLPQHAGVPQHARDCVESCGGVGTVRAVYVDAENGSPRPVLVAKCTACGQTYTDQNEGTPPC